MSASRLAVQPPCEADSEGVNIEPLRAPQMLTWYTENDIHFRQFMKLASHAVPTPAAERIIDLVLNLERLEDGGEVVQALALPPGSTGFPCPRRVEDTPSA